MTAQSRLFEDLDNTLATDSPAQRSRLLARVTDLYLAGAAKFSDDQVALFDDVLARLAEKSEQQARQDLARRLAAAPSAPPNIIRNLALDEAPGVAAPLLIHANRLDDTALVECARTRGPVHLLAISKRAVVSEPVTDVLVVRGTDMVIRSVADNSGSRFSNAGFGALLRRAEGNDALVTRIAARPDLPRHHFLRLLAKASDDMRARIEAARGETAEDFVRGVVAKAAEAAASKPKPREYGEAIATVASLQDAGSLGEFALRDFAQASRFEHTTVALAHLADLPIATVERAMQQPRPESLLLIAKAVGLTPPTVQAILRMRLGPDGASPQAIEQALSSFDRIRRATAEQVLGFQRARAGQL